jgi:hypothetical protein
MGKMIGGKIISTKEILHGKVGTESCNVCTGRPWTDKSSDAIAQLSRQICASSSMVAYPEIRNSERWQIYSDFHSICKIGT